MQMWLSLQVTLLIGVLPCQVQGFCRHAHPMVPFPSFGIDGLSYSSQHLQGAGVAPLHMVVSLAHQRPDQSWGSVELLNL